MHAKPIRIGMIGVGAIANLHARGYLAAGAQLYAAADVSAAALSARQREWGLEKTYEDYHDLLADPDVDAVSVCLPNNLHHPATMAAAEAGKHILCEKPISMSLEQAEEMIHAANRAGVILQVGHHLRSDPAAVRAKNMIDSGQLGRITFIRLRQAHDWSGASHVRDSFGKLANSGGGTLLDNGCHMMDLARYFGGDVLEVYARAATLGFDIEVEDTAVVSLEFRSGTLGSVENAWTATGWENAFSIYGTKGALEYTNRSGTPILRYSFRESPNTTWGDTDIGTFTFGGSDAHTASIFSFLASIRGEKAIVCTGEDGYKAVRLVLASYESARERKPVTLAKLELS